MTEPFVHETIDHPSTPGNLHRFHDYTVDQYECQACHDGAHVQYEQDVNELEDGTIVRDTIHHHIYPDDTLGNGIRAYHGPTYFLRVWHEHNGYCPTQ